MLRTPDHRYRSVRDSTEELTDSRESALAARISGMPCPVAEVAYAVDLYENEEHRPALDAFLLAKASLDVVSQTLDIPVAILETYQHFFMDVSVFRNKLELISYATHYESTPYGKELVRTAVTVGLDYLLWAYGGSAGQLDSRHVIRKTMVDAYFRGMAHKGNALTSNIAKESLKWWLTAIKNAESLEKIDPHTTQDAVDELRIALSSHDDSLAPDEAPVPISEIMH